MENVGSTMPPETTQELTEGRFYVMVITIIFPLIFFAFDSVLLAATIHNRRDTSLPLAYIAVMCATGMLTTFFMSFNIAAYLALREDYSDFMAIYGREITLAGTFSYLDALFVSVLMTVNRVSIVIRPFNNDWFTQPRIFFYSGIISVLVFISLIIPYFTECFVVFRADLLTFISGCAPDRHPITYFQNTYAIILPFSCMFVNLGLIFHLRFVRNGTYAKIAIKVSGTNKVNNAQFVTPTQPTALSKMQARRDLIMMRQTVSIAVYLSVYELGAFIIRTFPDQYSALPKEVRDGFFYFRFESIPIMNFFIYYVETGSTRRMFRRFLNIRDGNPDSGVNQTVVTVAPKANPRVIAPI